MLTPSDRDAAFPDAGLCRSCVFARTVISAKGSKFIMCRLSLSDSRYAKYPALPVQKCDGYAVDPPPDFLPDRAR